MAEKQKLPPRARLVKAAKELTEVLDLDPPIDVKAKTPQLAELVKKAAELIEEGDEFTEGTLGVLKALGFEIEEEPEEPEEEGGESEAEGEAKEEPETESETEAETEAPTEEEAETEPEPEKPKPKAKSKGKKAKGKKAETSKTSNLVREGEKNKYGHFIGTQADMIDSMLEKGATKEEVINALVTEFKREKSRAASRFYSHIRALKQKGFTVENEDGVYKLSM